VKLHPNAKNLLYLEKSIKLLIFIFKTDSGIFINIEIKVLK